MEKIIEIAKIDADIVIKVNSKEGDSYADEYVIKNNSLNAKALYDLLDYKLGDRYEYKEINAEGKDKLILEKLKELLESITTEIVDIDMTSEEEDVIDKINNIEENDNSFF